MVDKALFWNIRLVNTQNAFERLIDLNKRSHCSFIVLMEPFQGQDEIQSYKVRIGFDHVVVNISGKI